MAKYTFEFKKQIVMDYINGGGGTQFLAKKYGIPNHSQLQRWVASYKKFGDAGLMRSRKNNKYT